METVKTPPGAVACALEHLGLELVEEGVGYKVLINEWTPPLGKVVPEGENWLVRNKQGKTLTIPHETKEGAALALAKNALGQYGLQ